MVKASLRNVLVALSLSAVLSACGGGGGGSGDDIGTVGNNPPVGLPNDPAPTPNPGTGSNPNPQRPPQKPGQPDLPAERSATLIWEAPNTRTDGTCLGDVTSYVISYGLASGVYDGSVNVEAGKVSCVASGVQDSCGEIMTCTYTVGDLGTASWYFAVQAEDGNGQRSGYSNEVVKTIQ